MNTRVTRHASVGLVVAAIIMPLLLVVLVLFSGGPIGAQTAATDDAVAKRRAQLEAQLEKIEKQIQYQQVLLDGKQEERVSLERDVAILDAQIEKARLGIQARAIAIEELSDEIYTKQTIIVDLNEKLEREKESMAQLLRKTNEIDDLSMVEIILSNKSLSEFFEDLDAYEAVKVALSHSFDVIEDTRKYTEAEKQALEGKRGDEVELKTLQELEAQKVEQQEAEKERILNVTKGEEAEYQALINQNQRTAAEIRAELFALRDTTAIPFGQALELANNAGTRTGVRPALILGVLTQETKLGEFLGSGNYLSDMHPTRDRPLFLAITKELGLDPMSVPVSAAPSYGWGGAMGPAQFIPSTWACYGGWINTRTNDCNNAQRTFDWDTFWAGPWRYDANQDRLRIARGKGSPSNPWDNQDAFFGTAMLMKDNGADRGGYANERLAALRYFAGWANAENPSYAFYGDGVMEHASYYQKQIDILKGL